MSHRLASAVRRSWLGRQVYRRHWRQTSDVCLLSFPKTGRSWVRVMLGRALQRHYALDDSTLSLKIDALHDLNEAVPRVRLTHDDNPHLKTPAELVQRKNEYRDVRVILMVRDIRDLVVASYFQMTRRGGHYEGGLDAFLKAERGSVSSIIAFYNIWAENRDVPRRFLLMRYEDLRTDPAGGLRKMLAFSGVKNPADTLVADAVNTGSLQNMKRMVMRRVSGGLSQATEDQGELDAESFKMRHAKIGCHVEYLTPEQIEMLTERLRKELSPIYGYG